MTCLVRFCLTTTLLAVSIQPAVAQQQKWDVLREAMVRNCLESEGVSSSRVLNAMRRVPRHEFVPGAERARAYDDVGLAIGNQQTISPPYIVAYMTESLDPQPGDKVLEIGTGSGYQAAVLAEIVKEVYSIEIVPALAKSATRRLKELKYNNVYVMQGDGYKGWPEHAPFDKIIVTCSPEDVPAPLIEQLKEGGRMIIPVGERYQQSFHLLRKVDGKMEDERLIPTLFVPMTGTSEEQRRIQPNPKLPQLVNGSFEEDENEDGKADGWHYQRQTLLCKEEPMDGDICLRFENKMAGTTSQALQGMAIDGKSIAAIQLRYWFRSKGITPGTEPGDQAGVVLHFYDSIRREIGTTVLGKWRGTLGWQDVRSTVEVPPNAREVIIRIGLNGAMGQLDMDNIRMTTVPR